MIKVKHGLMVMLFIFASVALLNAENFTKTFSFKVQKTTWLASVAGNRIVVTFTAGITDKIYLTSLRHGFTTANSILLNPGDVKTFTDSKHYWAFCTVASSPTLMVTETRPKIE